jgi:toxin-antitoxin system PIN domain toxin
MTELLDGNVLVALVLKGHIHHERCNDWFACRVVSFATCSVTQGTLLRLHMQMAVDSSAHAAWNTLQEIVKHPKHCFWNDEFSYLEVPHNLLSGHRQITEAWLAELARRRSGKVATLDASFAALYPNCVDLLPVI